MRKAFTLVELLVVVTVLPFLLVAVSGVYTTFIRDIPHTTRILQENTTVLHLLGQIRRDMDAAVGLPEQSEGRRAGARTLLIEQPGRVICYQIEDGRIVRTVLSGAMSEDTGQSRASVPARPEELCGDARPAKDRLWRTRDAVIAWRLWQRDGKSYAVEIHSYVKQRVEGVWREKLANTQVFFSHGLAEEGEIR